MNNNMDHVILQEHREINFSRYSSSRNLVNGLNPFKY